MSEFDSDGVPDTALAAWGVAGPEGGAHVVGNGGRSRQVAFVESAEPAAVRWGRFTGGSTWVEWVDPVPAAPEDGE
ncbi:hypothetical protein [Streptomyces millisiae]|uniref:DUF397 domain-containing protein n=1 Tax=Streptomyces millisiae TaxID=3075542 RepID=A0ABU2LZY9_9ACTN|nr:hypothetical protein [Streptomyces sp. DSM 44918]MDT0323144.1 hypothetical protein [Streptomyces sp. DSM 44918]